MFAYAREVLGESIELCHDTHERINPSQTVQLAQSVEPYRLFFLEDSLPPEQNDHFRVIRQHSTVPIAMGELFVNVHEYVPLIKERLIDFIRVHMSDIGGITPMRKLAALCEFFGVRVALHGPGDCSPVGMMANLAIDMASTSFGIQEYAKDTFDPAVYNAPGSVNKNGEVFPGLEKTRLHDSMLWPNGESACVCHDDVHVYVYVCMYVCMDTPPCQVHCVSKKCTPRTFRCDVSYREGVLISLAMRLRQTCLVWV
jgi:mannonate dehydratase